MFDELFKALQSLPPGLQFFSIGVLAVCAVLYATLRGLKDSHKPEVQAAAQTTQIGQQMQIPWWLVTGPVPEAFAALYEIRELARQDHQLSMKIEEYLDKMLELTKQEKEILTNMEKHWNTVQVEASRMRGVFEVIRDESRLR